jgi:hypothetical protein
MNQLKGLVVSGLFLPLSFMSIWPCPAAGLSASTPHTRPISVSTAPKESYGQSLTETTAPDA